MNLITCPLGHLLEGSEKYCPECGLRINNSELASQFAVLTNSGPIPTSTSTLSSSVYSYGRNHQILASAVAPHAGSRLTTRQISDIVLTFDPSFQQGSLLVNDHAEGNAGACRCAGSELSLIHI